MNEHDKKVIKTMDKIIRNLKTLETLLSGARDINVDIESYQAWKALYILESKDVAESK
jgi:hypothetical protein